MRHFDGYMKGVNLGGWLSQCNERSKEYFDSFILEDDIKKIRAAGFDHVRLPVDYDVIEDEAGKDLPEGLAHIDDCVRWCRSAGLHMILDLHKTFGYTFDPLEKEMDKEAFFSNAGDQERFCALWDRLSARYAKDADIVAFELLNEIVSYRVADAWNRVADRAVRVIRKNAPEAYILVGGVCYNSVTTVPLLEKPLDDRVVLNFHCYDPMIFTHQGAYWVEHMPADLRVEYPGNLEDYREKSKELDPNLASAIYEEELTGLGPDFFEKLFGPALQTAEAYGSMLYCGEYGVIDGAPVESARRWFSDIHTAFEKFGIGRAVWNYKEKDFGDTVQACLF